MKKPIDYTRIRGITRSAEEAPFYERVPVFGLVHLERCWSCGLVHPLAMFYGGWKRFAACMNHMRDSHGVQYHYSYPPVQQRADPQSAGGDAAVQRQIDYYKLEGFSVEDLGCRYVTGHEEKGPAYITEIKTSDGRRSVVFIGEAVSREMGVREFASLRSRATLNAIRRLMAEQGGAHA